MNIFLCFTTPHLYAFMAAFRTRNRLYPTMLTLSNIFEGVFLLDMILNCFKQYVPQYSNQPVKDVPSIMMNYLNGELKYDIIPLIPFQYLTLYRKRERLFFMIKIIRMKESFQYFNNRTVMKHIKAWQLNYLSKLPQTKDEEEEVKLRTKNITHNQQMLFFQFGLQTFELICIILFMSYHFGMLWIILCEGVEDFINDTDYIYDHDSHPDNFIVAYHLYDDNAERTALDVTYFAFTSLSTVGFGDFNPKNNYERILCAFMLLFGVAVFSYIMN